MNAPINPFDLLPETAEIGPGLYRGMSNEDYHTSPGISKSGLDMIAKSPSVYEWNKKAPVDDEKLKALDMGTAIHCLMLEPEEFIDRFIIAPPFNGRTNAGKEEKSAFYAECAELGKTIMTAEEGRQLHIMRNSAHAHPMVRWLWDQEGENETSIFWSDDGTGELCRFRPDRMLTSHNLLVDVKKVDDMSRMKRHIEEFRYHVQDAMYCEGYRAHFNEQPQFWFVAISSSISAGRYPVEVFDLTPEWKEAGRELFRRDLDLYHACKVNNDWLHVSTLERPRWAA